MGPLVLFLVVAVCLLMAMATHRDNLLRLGALVTARVAEVGDGEGEHVKLIDLFSADPDLIVWFGRYFKSPARKCWLESTALLPVSCESVKRQLFISPGSSITVHNIHTLPNLNDPAVPAAPPQPPQLPQLPLGEEEEEDENGGDGGCKFGQRTSWEDITLHDGSPFELIVPPHGFAVKVHATSSRRNAAQLAHAVWCQSHGDKSVNPYGSKMLPQSMETSMQLRGTAEGAAAYPDDPHMVANVHGQPTYRVDEQLTALVLKAYAAQPRVQLVNQLANLERDEAALQAAIVEAGPVAGPIAAKVMRMSSDAMRDELKKYKHSHGQTSSGSKAERQARLLALFEAHPELAADL
jgi:hypothetical protein